jgi:hypothetical protein
MDVKSLRRDPEAAAKAFAVVDETTWIAKANCKIMIPARFVERGLGALEPDVYTIAIFAFIVEDKFYGVYTTPNFIRLTPTDISYTKVEDVEYILFHFDKGSVISPNLDLVMRDTLVFFVYDELLAKGNSPWFIDYDDIVLPFEDARESLGVKLGANHAIMEVIAASVVRDANDKSVYFREIVANGTPIPLSEKELDKSTVVPLRSVTHGPTNTTAKLSGAYFKEGVFAALANPSDTTETIEDLLRR